MAMRPSLSMRDFFAIGLDDGGVNAHRHTSTHTHVHDTTKRITHHDGSNAALLVHARFLHVGLDGGGVNADAGLVGFRVTVAKNTRKRNIRRKRKNNIQQDMEATTAYLRNSRYRAMRCAYGRANVERGCLRAIMNCTCISKKICTALPP